MQHSIIELKKGKKNTYRYRQIADDIKSRIQFGVYPCGTALPPMRNLAKGYNVALMTIVQAVNTISDEGAIEVRAGVGSFVPGQKPKESGAPVVGLVLSGDTSFDSWYAHFLDGLIASLKPWKGQLKYYFFNPAQDNWQEVLNAIGNDNVKALLRTPNPGHYDEDEVSANLNELSVPVITVGSYDSEVITNSVSYNFANITTYAVKQLIERGHKKLAILHSGKGKLHHNREVSEGFQLGLQQCGLNYEPYMEVTDHDSRGEVCMKQLYSGDYSPTGVIMTGAFIQGVSHWLGKNKKLRQAIECVAIVGRPELSTSLLPNFVAYMLVPARHLGYEAGKFSEKIAVNPPTTHEKLSIPFSMLKIIE